MAGSFVIIVLVIVVRGGLIMSILANPCSLLVPLSKIVSPSHKRGSLLCFHPSEGSFKNYVDKMRWSKIPIIVHILRKKMSTLR